MVDDLSKEFATFEEMKHVDGNGTEYWFARELMVTLDYARWDSFEGVIKKAMLSVNTANGSVDNLFSGVRKMVLIGYGNDREVMDYRLTRYACYLIAMNGTPTKVPIARAQKYFADQTRRHELQEIEQTDSKRLDARKKLTATEKKFAGVVMDRGVDRFGLAEIKAVGDQHLFGGNSTQDMKNKYGLKGKKPLADVLPTVSLKAKDLAAEMTTVNTELKNLRGKNPIGNEHVQNNDEVRDALHKRGIHLEHLPPEEDIRKVERRIKAEDKRKLKSAEKPLKIDNPKGFDDTMGMIAKAGK
jgi:DNA-damage-inducible protein D